jgi:hypothetical protein
MGRKIQGPASRRLPRALESRPSRPPPASASEVLHCEAHRALSRADVPDDSVHLKAAAAEIAEAGARKRDALVAVGHASDIGAADVAVL